jgi:hypothetical protein
MQGFKGEGRFKELLKCRDWHDFELSAKRRDPGLNSAGKFLHRMVRAHKHVVAGAGSKEMNNGNIRISSR